ncbi:MAG: hypothetical protein LIP01_07025 [Tannerellaceae bacterium]|nr:hypothetical protein [Tannerellaceae bacterium]
MILFIRLKQLGKRKDVIREKPFKLDTTPSTVQELITAIVRKQVAEFNDCPEENTFLTYLTNQQITDQAEAGKVGFGLHYNQKKADVTEATTHAILSFEDGLYRIFLNEQELIRKEQSIQLADGDRLTFIGLTMLAGRMW